MKKIQRSSSTGIYDFFHIILLLQIEEATTNNIALKSTFHNQI